MYSYPSGRRVSGKVKAKCVEKLEELEALGAMLIQGENAPKLMEDESRPFKMGKPVIERLYELFQHLNWTDIDRHEGPDNFTYCDY